MIPVMKHRAVHGVLWAILVVAAMLAVWSDSARASMYHTGSPVVAMFALPSNSSLPACGGRCEHVSASYVKWVESAGARAVPLSFTASPEDIRQVLDVVNGLFLTGGTPPLPRNARWAIQYAIDLNAGERFFPVWGTCLGWEWIAESQSGDDEVVFGGFDGKNMTGRIGLLPGANDSRLLSGIPDELLRIASVETLVSNNHHLAVQPEAFRASRLSDIFRVLAVDRDRAGKPYIGMVEAFELPIYGIQWHPEKSQFEWGVDPDGTPHMEINHTVEAIKLSQGLANFFVSETRRNEHRFPNALEDWESCMLHTREATPWSAETEQVYFLHFDGNSTGPACLALSRDQETRAVGAGSLLVS